MLGIFFELSNPGSSYPGSSRHLPDPGLFAFQGLRQRAGVLLLLFGGAADRGDKVVSHGVPRSAG